MQRMIKPRHWHELPQGDKVKSEVESQLSPWWPKVFGYHLLKLGPLSSQLSSDASTIARQYSVFDCDGADIIADPHHLPLQNASMDTVVMSFLMEFEKNPYRLLREIDRVLICGGYLFIVGFNPISPLFMGKVLPRYQTKLPWCGQFFMPSRVKDWLGLLGYQVLEDSRCLYHPLLTPYPYEQYGANFLRKWLPGTGSVYVIVARKLSSPLTPIQDKKRARQTNWTTAPSAGRVGKQS
jgi:SAM-dependent methyltransferase